MPSDVLVDLTALSTPSRYDGTGRYIRDLGRAMALLGQEQWHGLAIGGLCALEGSDAIGPLDGSGASRAHWRRGEELGWLCARRTRLAVTLRRLRPRLFHATYHMGTPRGSGVPRVTSCFDLVRLVLRDEYLSGRPIYRRMLWAAEALRFHSARRVQAISQHTADDLMRLLGVPSAKIDVIHEGIDHSLFRPLGPADEARAHAVLRRHGLQKGGYFLYVGNADPRKNVDVLVAAFVAAQVDGVELVLVGRMRPADQARVDAALRAQGNPPLVRQLGYVPDRELPTIYGGALGLVFCSCYEGFGLTPVEAMACGCPVVHTGLSSMQETIGDAGLVVPVRDVAATAHALRRLVGEPTLASHLSRAGLARARRFDFLRTARETIEGYERALR